MKVTLIIFTLNEIDGMKAVMPQIKKEWYDELIIVDGGSTDGTIEYAREHGYFIFVQKEKGAGAAFTESVGLATGDAIIIFSPDGNSQPETIPRLIEKMKEGYDMVIASRHAGGAKSYDDDIITAFGNWMFTTLTNLLFRAKYTDTLVMYRIFKKEIVEKLGIKTRSPAWGTQMCIRCAKKKLKVADIPADEPPRIGGKRKMKPFANGVQELSMIIGELFRNE